MFAYCGNNPINRIDTSGMIWGWIAVGIVVTVCAVAITSCGNQNTISAPPDYVQENSIYHNCYSYAFHLPQAAYPGMYSISEGDSSFVGDGSKAIYNPEEIAQYVERDMNALGIPIRQVDSPKDKLANEFIVAMKTSDKLVPGYDIADVHFAVQLSDGSWADKQGIEPSRWNVLDGTAITWDIISGDAYYNTKTIYFAVGE